MKGRNYRRENDKSRILNDQSSVQFVALPLLSEKSSKSSSNEVEVRQQVCVTV